MTEPQSADAEPARKCTDKTRRVAMSPFESNDALRRAERSWHDGVTFAKALRSPPAAALEKVECPLWVDQSHSIRPNPGWALTLEPRRSLLPAALGSPPRRVWPSDIGWIEHREGRMDIRPLHAEEDSRAALGRCRRWSASTRKQLPGG